MTCAIVGVLVGEGEYVAVLVGEIGVTKVVGEEIDSVTIVIGEIGVTVWSGSSDPHKSVPQEERSTPVRTIIMKPLLITEFIGQIIPHLIPQLLTHERFAV